MPYGLIFLIVCCAIFYYRVGEAEYAGGALLSFISVLLYVIGTFLFPFGFFGNLLMQIGLFVALTFYIIKRKPKL